MDDLVFVATLLAALGCGLIAGVYLAFSSFLLKALDRLAPPAGISAMQSITRAIKSPFFLTLFFATAALAALLGLAAPLRWSAPGSLYLLLGSLLYLNGAFGVTLFNNRPLNNKLAVANPDSEAGARFWREFLSSWTFWNHIRTATSFAAAACFTWALVEMGNPLPARD